MLRQPRLFFVQLFLKNLWIKNEVYRKKILHLGNLDN